MLIPEQLQHHTSPHNADLVCPHCRGITSHEPWCSTHNLNVRYAFQVISYPDCLSRHDAIILHALGVTWEQRKR